MSLQGPHFSPRRTAKTNDKSTNLRKNGISDIVTASVYSEIARLKKLIMMKMIIGERSEPLSRVLNDQPRDIYIYMAMSIRTYVSNTHAHVCMSIGVFCDRNSSAKKRKTFYPEQRSSGISNVQSTYVNFCQCACMHADC